MDQQIRTSNSSHFRSIPLIDFALSSCKWFWTLELTRETGVFVIFFILWQENSLSSKGWVSYFQLYSFQMPFPAWIGNQSFRSQGLKRGCFVFFFFSRLFHSQVDIDFLSIPWWCFCRNTFCFPLEFPSRHSIPSSSSSSSVIFWLSILVRYHDSSHFNFFLWCFFQVLSWTSWLLRSTCLFSCLVSRSRLWWAFDPCYSMKEFASHVIFYFLFPHHHLLELLQNNTPFIPHHKMMQDECHVFLTPYIFSHDSLTGILIWCIFFSSWWWLLFVWSSCCFLPLILMTTHFLSLPNVFFVCSQEGDELAGE